MKWLLLALFALGGVVVALGPPGPRPERTRSFNAAVPVLPMTFSHADHGDQQCATCHHNLVDRISGLTCISCHVSDPKVSHLFENQFHTLCRSCHLKERAARNASGPTRRCIDCHLPDDDF